MAVRKRETCHQAQEAALVGVAVHAALCGGFAVGRQVKIGVVRGVVIGYNIARRGRYPGARFPLLVKTELGIAKCRLDEVLAV